MPAAPRLHVAAPLAPGATIALPEVAVRHVQVLRLQPGDPVILFGACAPDGTPDPAGGEYEAAIAHMGRRDASATVQRHKAIEREGTRQVTLAIGMPANERMDWLVEKATELGVATIQPLMTERSVLRLDAERARKKTAHWEAVAVAACEQCGRNRVPAVHDALALGAWLDALKPAASGAPGSSRCVLSLHAETRPLRELVAQAGSIADTVTLLVGPEGGLSDREDARARARGFTPVTLGPRVLRAETAALAALAWLA